MEHPLKVQQMVNDMENPHLLHQDVAHLRQYLYRENPLDVLDALQNRDGLLPDDCLTLEGVRRGG